MVRIRTEEQADADGVRAVNMDAFPTPLEADLVQALKKAGKAVISLVAEEEERVIGHILFSPVSVEVGDKKGLGLAPVGVLRGSRAKGVGSRLILEGLERAKGFGYDFIVVLGEPEYYRRFGFEKASPLGLANEYGVDDPFMVRALRHDGLEGVSGVVRYQPEFGMSET